jgi:hypothetical protein
LERSSSVWLLLDLVNGRNYGASRSLPVRASRQETALAERLVAPLRVKTHNSINFEKDENASLHPLLDCALTHPIALRQRFFGDKWALYFCDVFGGGVHERIRLHSAFLDA